jgi:hypothetical protein
MRLPLINFKDGGVIQPWRKLVKSKKSNKFSNILAIFTLQVFLKIVAKKNGGSLIMAVKRKLFGIFTSRSAYY